jgi:cytochrome c biogenesis protein CcmG/thiol:disulfide interchange protein DsbE
VIRRTSTQLFCAVAALVLASTVIADDLPSPGLQGKVVYLDFWASWCGPCRQSFPWMNELQRELGSQGLVVVAVNVDHERADANRFLASYPADFRVLFDPDGRLAERYKVAGMPTSFIIGRDGKIVATHAGFKQKDAESLAATVRRVVEAH